MRSARQHRFTVYDVMEAQGKFDDNPANSTSPDFKGPLEYPNIMYHPQGKERVIQRAEIIATPLGPKRVGELKELISRTVNDPAEELGLSEKGWHHHPSQAIAASGREAPPVVSGAREAELEGQIAALQAQLALTRNAPKAKVVDPDDVEVAPMRSRPPASEARAK